MKIMIMIMITIAGTVAFSNEPIICGVYFKLPNNKNYVVSGVDHTPYKITENSDLDESQKYDSGDRICARINGSILMDSTTYPASDHRTVTYYQSMDISSPNGINYLQNIPVNYFKGHSKTATVPDPSSSAPL